MPMIFRSSKRSWTWAGDMAACWPSCSRQRRKRRASCSTLNMRRQGHKRFSPSKGSQTGRVSFWGIFSSLCPKPPIVTCSNIFKYILHHWPDVEATKIATHVGNAARASNGTVIPVEKIMLQQVVDDPGHAAALHGDMTMMLWNGEERTLPQFRELLAAGGLSLTRVLPLSDNLFAIEAVPAS